MPRHCDGFVFEFYRGDPGRGEIFGGFITGTQLIALGLVIGGFIIYWRRIPLRSFETAVGKKSPATSRA